MFENIMKFFNKFNKKQDNKPTNSREAAKERLHLVLMQDRANVSADFLELMKQEIIEVIKKYIDVDESAIDVRLTNKENPDGTNGAPALYANIPILNIKNEARKIEKQVETDAENEIKDDNKDMKDDDKEIEKKEKKEDNKEVEKTEDEKDEKVDNKDKSVKNKSEEKVSEEETKKENNEEKEDVKEEKVKKEKVKTEE